jgi:hypothetical protein
MTFESEHRLRRGTDRAAHVGIGDADSTSVLCGARIPDAQRFDRLIGIGDADSTFLPCGVRIPNAQRSRQSES